MFEFIKEHDGYLNLPDMEIENNPLNMEVIKNKQSQDSDLERWKNKYPNEYFYTNIGDVRDILCHCKPGKDKKEHWKIVLPSSMLKSTIKWFHLITGHPGERILQMAIESRFYHPEIRNECVKFKCDLCQRHKLPEKDMVCCQTNKLALKLSLR